MSDIRKDISKVWDRLFDQKGFLNGEINFFLREFEEKRGDTEIDNLFKSIEIITDIKDTQINRLIESGNEKAVVANQQLSEALKLCNDFVELEERSSQNLVLQLNQEKRKDNWEKVMAEITSEYTKINSEFEEKENQLVEEYKVMESKLK